MNWLVAVAEFVVNEILAVPAYLIGIITAVGLIALRKGTGQVIGGALKATLGFLLIGAGAGLVVASLKPLGVMIQGRRAPRVWCPPTRPSSASRRNSSARRWPG